MNAKDKKQTRRDVIMKLRTSLEEGSLWLTPGSQKTFHVLLCWAQKMDDILMELNLETLAAVFQREIMVPSIVWWVMRKKNDLV